MFVAGLLQIVEPIPTVHWKIVIKQVEYPFYRWKSTIKRILIIRLSAIGDVVFASPLAHALRRRYPDAKIAWLAEPMMSGLLEKNPDIDTVIIWPKNDWKQLWRAKKIPQLWNEVSLFIHELRQQHFDVVLDIQGLLKSAVWAWFSGAKRRIGLMPREGSHWLMTETVDPQGQSYDESMISSEYQYLAQHLGLDTDNFPLTIGLSEDDEQFVKVHLGEEVISEGYVVICPFTTRPQKHWIDDSWRELILRLQSLGIKVIMLGGRADQKHAKSLIESEQLINLVGQTSISQAAAVIKNAILLIGVDTGLTHIGTAFKRPSICIFGSTCPYMRTSSSDTHVIYKKLQCSPCQRRPTCNEAFDCMQKISVDEIMETANPYLTGT